MPARLPFENPLLSIVAASRNDNHGGDPLVRTQIFINSFLDQCREKKIPAELILVEWNPPADRPPLAEDLSFDRVSDFAACRVFSVAPALHATLRHAARLPLYQMIAKNVGIRRARGEFVLATNIDILFSGELMDYIAARRLRPDRMYRVDRLDIQSGVPARASWAEQLDYAWGHVIRENHTKGSVAVSDYSFDRRDAPEVRPVEL